MNKFHSSLIVTLLLFIPVQLFAAALPFQGVTGYQQYENKFELYAPLTVGITKNKTIVYGNRWQIKFKGTAAMEKGEFFDALSQANPDAVEKEQRHDIRLYAVTQADKVYWIKVNYNGSWYQVNAVLKQPYQPILTLTTDQPLTYNKRIKAQVPDHILIPRIKGYQIEIADFKKFNSLTLRYKDSANKRVTQDLDGKFWKLSIRQLDRDEQDHRHQVTHNFKDELIRIGGTVLGEEQGKLYFAFNTETTRISGQLFAYDHSIEMTFVESQAFEQSLVMDPDKLKAELDAAGKVTLEGIYFDTGKATLKPASKPALDAVITLMTKYPDLVIEVQGHTDNVGNDQSNLMLADRRANAVKNAIVQASISTERLQSKGFGETKPIADNDTQEGRAKNRRVELHKLSGGQQQAIITIDFFKPMPDAVLIKKYNYEQQKFLFLFKDAAGKVIRQACVSDVTKYRYDIQDENGKRVKSLSRLEILKNYETILKQLKPESLYLKDNTLYFRLKDRGDGTPVMGIIKAYTGSYDINFSVIK